MTEYKAFLWVIILNSQRQKSFITEYGILLCKEDQITTCHFKFKKEVNEYSYQSNLLWLTPPKLQSWEVSPGFLQPFYFYEETVVSTVLSLKKGSTKFSLSVIWKITLFRRFEFFDIEGVRLFKHKPFCKCFYSRKRAKWPTASPEQKSSYYYTILNLQQRMRINPGTAIKVFPICKTCRTK